MTMRANTTRGVVALACALVAAGTLHAQKPRPTPSDKLPAPLPRERLKPTLMPARPAAAPPAAPATGRYRVSLVGFQANHTTWDNALQLDGKGDEVFVSSDVKFLDATGASIVPGLEPTLRSYIYGDVNGQTAPNRRQAGALSNLGGIGDGNSYPASPWAGVPDTRDPLAIPMVLWQGTLVRGQNSVIVTPTIWEYDGSNAAGAFDAWVSWAQRTATALRDNKTFGDMVGAQAVQIADLTVLGAGVALDLRQSVIGQDADRPVGMKFNGTQAEFRPQSLVLTYDGVERLFAQQVGALPLGVYPIEYRDAPQWWGDYTLYIKVEHLP
jgi:hypothetical protein